MRAIFELKIKFFKKNTYKVLIFNMDPSNLSQCVSQNYAKITKVMNTTIEKLNEIQKGKDNLGVSDFFFHYFCTLKSCRSKNPQFQIFEMK